MISPPVGSRARHCHKAALGWWGGGRRTNNWDLCSSFLGRNGFATELVLCKRELMVLGKRHRLVLHKRQRMVLGKCYLLGAYAAPSR